MAVKSTAVSVGTSPTRLDTVAETDRDTKSAVAVFNNGAVTVYVGDASVTTSSGFPVAAGSPGPAFSDLDWNEAVYGIVASGSADVRVLESGV